MAATPKYPREWLERVPAVVFACLLPGELRIIVHPGVGLADGGAPWDVPVDLIPLELRMPNTPLWLKLDEQMNILQVWRRDE
jgi:hypothetical protein